MARQGQADKRAVFSGVSGRDRRKNPADARRYRAGLRDGSARSGTGRQAAGAPYCASRDPRRSASSRPRPRGRWATRRRWRRSSGQRLRDLPFPIPTRNRNGNRPDDDDRYSRACGEAGSRRRQSRLRNDGRGTESQYGVGCGARDLGRQAILPGAPGQPVQAAQRLKPARGNRRRAGRNRHRRRILLARRAGDAAQHPAVARGARRGRDDTARRRRGAGDQHQARRSDGGVRAVGPFAHAGLFRDARRPARHGPYPRRAGPHHQTRPDEEGPRDQETCRGDARFRQCRPVERRSASSI